MAFACVTHSYSELSFPIDNSKAIHYTGSNVIPLLLFIKIDFMNLRKRLE